MAALTCAVIQLTSTQDVERNLAEATRHVREASRAGAGFVALPENAAFLRTDPAASAPIEALDGPMVSRMRELAGELGIWLLLGSFPEAIEGDGRYHNTSVLVDGSSPGAPITACYRKLHLFDIEMAGGESQRESDWIAAGDEIVCTPVSDVPTGLTICYDLRFPALYSALVDRGARMITVPSAFTEFTGKDHWLTLLQARAIETQCFVVAPNQFGHHGGKRRSYGKSAIVDPWGTLLCVAPDRPGWAMATLDFDHQDRIRGSLPCLQHRHPDLGGR